MKLRYRILSWLLRRRYYNWSPFDHDGHVDWPRLEKEGWHQMGVIVEDGRSTVSNKTWMRPAEAALVEAEAESEVHEPGMRVISDVREWRHIIGGQEMTWHSWAVPAILEVLAEQTPDNDGWGWCERIAPLIADRIACDPQRAIEALSRKVTP